MTATQGTPSGGGKQPATSAAPAPTAPLTPDQRLTNAENALNMTTSPVNQYAQGNQTYADYANQMKVNTANLGQAIRDSITQGNTPAGQVPATVAANHMPGSANPWEQNWNTSPAQAFHNLNPNNTANPAAAQATPAAPSQYQTNVDANPYYQTQQGRQGLAVQQLGHQLGLRGRSQQQLNSKLGGGFGGGKSGQSTPQVPSP